MGGKRGLENGGGLKGPGAYKDSRTVWRMRDAYRVQGGSKDSRGGWSIRTEGVWEVYKDWRGHKGWGGMVLIRALGGGWRDGGL